MIVKRVGFLLLLGAAAVGCSKDTDGDLVTPTVVAGLRYVNIVPDTGGMDIRVIDVVGDAPNTFNATFRTGGSPYGVAIAGLPPHTAVLAGTRNIRAFMSGLDINVASTIMFDTTFTFDANVNYTVYMYGYSRTGQAPALNAVIVRDDPADPGASAVAYRVLHLAPTVAPTLTTGANAAVDVYVDTLAAGATPVGAAQFANVAFGEVRAYVTSAARPAAGAVPALNYRAVVTPAGSTAAFYQGDVPNGTVSTTDPVPGDLVGGSGFTILIVPPSVAGSAATSFAAAGVLFLVDRRPTRGDGL